MGPVETMIPWLPVQKVNGNSATAAGPIEAMFPGLAGQNVNGKSAPAVGPIESMVPWLPGQKVNGNLQATASAADLLNNLRAGGSKS